MSLKQKEFQQRLLAECYGAQNTKFWSIKMKKLLVIIILLIIVGVGTYLVMERSQHSDDNSGHDHGDTTWRTSGWKPGSNDQGVNA